MDPYGKQADKRKKEVSDLEARVSFLSFLISYCKYVRKIFLLIKNVWTAKLAQKLNT